MRRTAARCAHVAKTYSIGRSFNGKELLVIEFSARPGQHELSKPLPLSGPQGEERVPGLLGFGCVSPGPEPQSQQGWFILCFMPGGTWPHPTGPAGAQWGGGSWGRSPRAVGTWAPVHLWGNVTVPCASCCVCTPAWHTRMPGRYVRAWSWHAWSSPLHTCSFELRGERSLTG